MIKNLFNPDFRDFLTALNQHEVERVLNITMAVAGEVAVVRERLDTIERLLAAKGILSNAEIEAYVPTDGEAEERQKLHAEYIINAQKALKTDIFKAFERLY